MTILTTHMALDGVPNTLPLIVHSYLYITLQNSRGTEDSCPRSHSQASMGTRLPTSLLLPGCQPHLEGECKGLLPRPEQACALAVSLAGPLSSSARPEPPTLPKLGVSSFLESTPS